jgi:hypothetical protein
MSQRAAQADSGFAHDLRDQLIYKRFVDGGPPKHVVRQ